MKIAYVGVGKLGFPCALVAAEKHDVVGYDVDPAAREVLRSRRYPHREVGAQALLDRTTLRIVDSIDEAVAHAEIVFVAVQTPHRPEFEGIARMPEERADFDYGVLRRVVAEVAESARNLRRRVVLDVISTVLPGTSARELYPLLNEYVTYVYSPLFIAMGTVILDYRHPEFVLLGCDRDRTRFDEALARVQQFYGTTAPDRPQVVMGVASAELAKVSYNVFLGQKIVAANAIMEIAHKVGADCDDVARALALATDRVVSSKYMRGGMGDGGSCHPRDQIALSWLARQLDLSRDVFGDMVLAREAQTEWLAELVREHAAPRNLPVVVLGRAYKAGTNLTVGSCATLLRCILDETSDVNSAMSVAQWDPHVDPPWVFDYPAAFVVATDHPEFYAMSFPLGSVIIDPWGRMPDREGVEVVRVGRS